MNAHGSTAEAICALGLLVIFLTGVGIADAAVQDGPLQPWVKRGLVIEPDFAGTSCDHFASGPSVVKLREGRLRMYFWAQCGKGTSASRNVFLAAEAHSSNPFRWTLISDRPLLGPDGGTEIRDQGVALPYVLPRDDGPWLMYYSALGSLNLVEGQARSARTGLAVSDDQGLSWRVLKEAALDVGDEGSFDALLTGSVGALRVDEGDYRLWYTAGEGMVRFGSRHRSIVHIGSAWSVDGVTWHKRDRPAMSPRLGAVDPYEAVLSKPAVLLLDGTYHMWLNVYRMARGLVPHQPGESGQTDRSRDDELGYRIEYARSSDGQSWRRYPGRAVMSLTPGAFDSKNQSYPSIIQVGSQLWMFYAGNGFGLEGIGLATLEKDALEELP